MTHERGRSRTERKRRAHTGSTGDGEGSGRSGDHFSGSVSFRLLGNIMFASRLQITMPAVVSFLGVLRFIFVFFLTRPERRYKLRYQLDVSYRIPFSHIWESTQLPGLLAARKPDLKASAKQDVLSYTGELSCLPQKLWDTWCYDLTPFYSPSPSNGEGDFRRETAD
jgi:hypothetical protein